MFPVRLVIRLLHDLSFTHAPPMVLNVFQVTCNQCRSAIFDEGRHTILAYPSSFHFPAGKVPLDFRPTAHSFYSQRIMEVPDGIPKWSGHKDQSELLPD